MQNARHLVQFRRKLLRWFPQFRRDLPWRNTKDPYRIWLSEIMLQQTRVAAVIPYYERFLEHFPDVGALAEAPEQEVLRLWAGLGYYSRARNLQKAAKQVVAVHHSRFPSTVEDTLALSGIGAYTAAAILSIVYGKKLAVLDGNVARVIARLTATRGDLRSGKRWQQLQDEADALLAAKQPGDWNQAMMELGATICTPRSPQCLLCPVAEFCEARKLGLVSEIPEKRKKRAPVEVLLAALVVVDSENRTLLLPPPGTGIGGQTAADLTVLLSRMWHFPTIAVRTDAEKELGLFVERKILHKKNVRCALQLLPKVRHTVTYRQITVHPFRWKVAKLPNVVNAKSISLSDLSTVPASNLTRKIARAALNPGANQRPPSGDGRCTLRTGSLGL